MKRIQLLPSIALLTLAAGACSSAGSTHDASPGAGDSGTDASTDGTGTGTGTGTDAGTDGTTDATLCQPNALRCDGQQPEQCNPAGDGWTKVGAACTNQACVAGACVGTCQPGTTQCSGDRVQACDATGSWGTAAACPSGDACDADAGGCTGGCYIGGTYYAAGALDPGSSCQSCQPTASTTAWTNVADGTSCTAGACCGGACRPVGTDVNNCGACGSVCNAGPNPACSSGWCNYTLASGQDGPTDIAVSATGVYWTSWSNNTSVLTVPLNGGSPTTLTSSGQLLQPFGIAVSSPRVYWIGGGELDEVSVGGGSSTPVANGDYVISVAVDATSVYWMNSSGNVVKSPLGGGTPTTLASTSSAPNVGGLVAVDATSVYYSAYFDNGIVQASTTIAKVPLGGGSPTTLASGPYFPLAIAVDATSVYWMNSVGPSASTVMKVPLGGGTPTTLASAQNGRVVSEPGSNPVDIAADATGVYWTDTGAGTVMKMPPGGGTPTTLASGQNSPQGIALDATSVYWLKSGSVMKAPKQ